MSKKTVVPKKEAKDNRKVGKTAEVLPQKIPKQFAEMFQVTMQSGGLPPQILDKINENHIDKVLAISEKTNEYIHKDGKSMRRYVFAGFVIGIILLIFLVILLKNGNQELLKQILLILVSLGGGFGAGYGYCKHKKQ